MQTPARFPIADVLDDIVSTLASHNRLVLEAPPGAGKTTQVPLALLDCKWSGSNKIIMLEPRRVAARAAAGFMARQLGESVGQTVGYRIRFENRVSAQTRIEVVTEGILTRMLQDDPMLEGVSALIFDEFHERHLAGDLGLALARDVQQSLRQDLRLVVMSATLDGENLSSQLNAPRISSAGRSWPVEISWFPALRNEHDSAQLLRCITGALELHEGDILVFLPGKREIDRLRQTLARSVPCPVFCLFGDMSIEAQSAILARDSDAPRRIILATNIAESSVTLPGVRVVIDTGLAREPRLDTASGFSRLHTVPISTASADQRAGRAGRIAPGWCYRLWPREKRLDASRTPEMQTTDLAGLALELSAWGNDRLNFITPPPTGALAAARDLLKGLHALDDSANLTDTGRRMQAFGTHPRLAAILAGATTPEVQSLSCDLVALSEARDPLTGSRTDAFYTRWQALADFRTKTRGNAPGVSRAELAVIASHAARWRKRLGCNTLCNAAAPHTLGALMIQAYPDRIARMHDTNPLRYKLSNGRMAMLGEDSSLIGEPWLVAVSLRFDKRDSLVLSALPVTEEEIEETFPERFVEEETVSWNSGSQSLESRRIRRFDQIMLDSRPGKNMAPELAARALGDAVASQGLSVLNWSAEADQWRQRVLCLRQWMPDLDLPDLTDNALLEIREQWLEPLYHGKSRLDSLSASTLLQALKSLCDWQTLQTIDREAPSRITVPSGLDRSITYRAGEEPVLAVKLQELFGLGETPRIASGRIPLTLHLLSPAGKPLQITRDLHSFWENTYPEVKKEMKGRYPKHPWPDDPWQAPATHRAKPGK